MSFNSTDQIPKSTQDLDDLLKDASALLMAYTRLQAENKALVSTLAQRDANMQLAQKRLFALLKRLPNQTEL